MTVSPPIVTQCSDGDDNDGDGRTDFGDDPGCISALDDDETDGLAQCSDGIDNDGDTFIDWADGINLNPDPGCSSALDNDERNLRKPIFIEF